MSDDLGRQEQKPDPPDQGNGRQIWERKGYEVNVDPPPPREERPDPVPPPPSSGKGDD